MRPDVEPTSDKPREITSLAVLGARLTWVIAGPLALLAIAGAIISSKAGWFTGLDLAFAIVTGLMLLARWVEQRSGAATTLTGEPGTPEQFKRYAFLMPLLAAVIWIVANIVGNHVLK